MSKKSPANVVGVVLASPADMVGLFERYETNPTEILEEANKNISQGNPLKIVSHKIYNWYYLSSQTTVDLFTKSGPADILLKFQQSISPSSPSMEKMTTRSSNRPKRPRRLKNNGHKL